jgi:antitoxin component YwqK of YwqJK toxin-antitoxin module
MKKLLTLLTCLFILSPNVVLGEEVKWGDLVGSKGPDFQKFTGVPFTYYKKFTEVPFTGTTTGQKQGQIRNGKMEGPWVEYHPSGLLYSKGTYKNGKKEGPWVSYHGNGQLGSKGTYKNGKKEGPWVTYQKRGTVVSSYTGTYKNGEKVSD